MELFENPQEAKKAQADFRIKAQLQSQHCVISGLRNGWSTNVAVGPGLHACYIVLSSFWALYPLPNHPSANSGEEVGSVEQRHRKWVEDRQRKWIRTWRRENALLMQSSIRTTHDARILAIHPKTFQIQYFTPYNLILPHHNKPTHLSLRRRPDTRALKFHWESCVIENMTAMDPLGDLQN